MELNGVGTSEPRVLCDNASNSAELIIPDVISSDRETEVSETETKTVKSKRGGLRPLNRSQLKQSTRSRLGTFGILPIINRDKKDT